MKNHWDVFVSFKNLGPDGHPTEDSRLARQVFDRLSQIELSVFFSSISLESLGVSAYQKAIDNALDAAKVLVAVGTSPENLESQWVRYEWGSFYNDILSGIKRDAKLFAYVKGIDIPHLPRVLRQNQVFVHQERSLDSLSNFVRNALGLQPFRLGTKASDLKRGKLPKGHASHLALCVNCGMQFDRAYPSACSFHTRAPEIIGNTGPREDYADVWNFPCCGTVVVGAVSREGRDIPPTNSPGCKVGEHAV
jgi:hypothetical protein